MFTGLLFLGHFNSVKLTLPVKFNMFGSMHLIRLISCAISKAEAQFDVFVSFILRRTKLPH